MPRTNSFFSSEPVETSPQAASPATLRELQVLCAVVATGRTTAAARQLSLSQPSISRTIAALEQRLGQLLFVRERGRLKPTPQALAIEARAAVIFNLMDRVAGDAPGQDPAAAIRLVCIPTLAHDFVARMLVAFLATEPQVKVHVEIGKMGDCIAAVADGTADLGLVDQASAFDGVRLEVFRQARAHVALPRRHRLAQRQAIKPIDLAGQPLIALSRRFPVRSRIDAAFAAARVEASIIAEGATSAFLVECVRHGLGLAILNPFPVELRGDKSLVFRPFEPEILFETAIVVPAATPLKPAARALASFIRREQPRSSHSTALT